MGRCAFPVAASVQGLSVVKQVTLGYIEADLNSHLVVGASSVLVVVGHLELGVQLAERELAVPEKARLPGESELVVELMELSELGIELGELLG